LSDFWAMFATWCAEGRRGLTPRSTCWTYRGDYGFLRNPNPSFQIEKSDVLTDGRRERCRLGGGCFPDFFAGAPAPDKVYLPCAGPEANVEAGHAGAQRPSDAPLRRPGAIWYGTLSLPSRETLGREPRAMDSIPRLPRVLEGIRGSGQARQKCSGPVHLAQVGWSPGGLWNSPVRTRCEREIDNQ